MFRYIPHILAAITGLAVFPVWALYGAQAAGQWLAGMAVLLLVVRIVQGIWRLTVGRDTWTRVGEALPPPPRPR